MTVVRKVGDLLQRDDLDGVGELRCAGLVRPVVEGGGEAPRPMLMARAMKSEAVPIERGTETLEANVTITWALK